MRRSLEGIEKVEKLTMDDETEKIRVQFLSGDVMVLERTIALSLMYSLWELLGVSYKLKGDVQWRRHPPNARGSRA